MCPADHPFIPVTQLEAEGQKLMEGAVTIFYTMPYVSFLIVFNRPRLNFAQEPRYDVGCREQLGFISEAETVSNPYDHICFSELDAWRNL